MKSAFMWVAVLFATTGILHAQPEYKYTIDLTVVENDRLKVVLLAPRIDTEEVIFYLPKIIPGTYSIADYGRFVDQVKAFDRKGRALAVEKIDANGWKIAKARKLHTVTYWVDDVLDAEKEGPAIYPMAATNIEEGKNFVLNTSGFFGYFENHTGLPVRLEVIRPKEFYGSTGLVAEQAGLEVTRLKKEVDPDAAEKRVDRYFLENYDRLIDSPLMYAMPDTALIRVANTEVLIGAYSPTGMVNARQIANTVREVLQAQAKYLGGTLPVDKYAFIFYFTDKPVNVYGALEHWYSSFYYMPEQTIDKMQQQLRDFAAHEFFHIVTPLNIHSKEIHAFGFNKPAMSKHLWMYEGVTEYFAGNVQVKYNLISPEAYLNVLHQKMTIASGFRDDVAFTDISKFTLEKYSDQYYNVYQKGALIGMCLDIRLRKLSAGKYGLQNLMTDLAEKYGKNQPFDDEALFQNIEELTFPEIGVFLRRYVGGAEKLPLAEVFEMVGVDYQPEVVEQTFSLGFSSSALRLADVEGKKKLSIGNLDAMNEFGRRFGFQKGDILEGVNGQPLPAVGPELAGFLNSTLRSLEEGKQLTYSIVRADTAGTYQKLELGATVVKVPSTKRHVISFNAAPTAEQLAIRNSWITPGQ